MLYVALAAVVALTATSLASASIVRSLIRQQARERELLLNQIMHLSGRTWAPPPAEPAWVPPVEEDPEPMYDSAQTADY